MHRDPIPDARALVRKRYPQALWAVLAGSVLTAHRTPGSDLDLVVVLPPGDPLAPRRESLVFREWPAELFVHDEQTLDHWLGEEFAARKPTLHRMVGAGVALVGSPAEWQERCREVLEAGPDPLPGARRELRALDTDLAEGWLRARNDEAAIAALAREVLDRLGGPLFDGFHAVAPRPADTARA